MSKDGIALDETIHQPTRLRIMTMLVSQERDARLAYGFIQRALELTGGNLTTHLRRLEDAGYLETTKVFEDSRPRTWISATTSGRRAYADYLVNLKKALDWSPPA